MNDITEYLTKLIQDPVGNGLLLSAVFLCFVFLWYWKISTQIGTLFSIDKKLGELGEEVAGSPPERDDTQMIEEILAGAMEIANKSESTVGKVYTEEELDTLIRE